MNAITDFSCQDSGLPRVDDILSLLLPRLVPVAKAETVPLAQAMGRVLARDVTAQVSAPPCDRSAMDGYAFRFGDAGPLRLAGRVKAGELFMDAIGPGECVAIATGASLPLGCDTVAMREHCDITKDGVVVSVKAEGANVRRRGEDFQAGATLLKSGVCLGARHIGLLAAAGVERVAAYRPLRIALLSMGDELVGTASDSIRDANRPMLQALCAANDYHVTDLGVLPDDRTHLAKTLAHAAASHDVVITSAGTSAGDEDHLLGAMLDCGGRPLIAGAAIKPGKPIAFGEIDKALCIALPGNPAAAYITFLVLGLPLLRRLSGRVVPPTQWHSVTVGFNHRKKPGLREYLRVHLMRSSDGALCAARCEGDGSAALASLAGSDGLVMLDESRVAIREGDPLLFATFHALESA